MRTAYSPGSLSGSGVWSSSSPSSPSSPSSLIRSTETTCSPSAVLKHDHALRDAPSDADALDRTADQLSAIGDEHDLVGLLDRERGDERTVALVDHHGDDPFAAAPGDTVLVGRGPLAVAVFRDGQDELLGRRHFRIALGRESSRRRSASSASTGA